MDLQHTERSLGELVSDLSQQTSDLIRQEMRLAKMELGEKLSSAGRHVVMSGAAAAIIAAFLPTSANFSLNSA